MKITKPIKSIPIFLIIILVTGSSIQAQSQGKNYDEATKTIDSTLENLYAVISGEKGEARDWDLFRHLFHADAKLIPTRKQEDGSYNARFMTAEDYINTAGTYLVENGFFEKEIYRTVNSFGSITQVFSTYESYRSEADTEPFARGINSIQLLNDGTRWWIINIYWASESEDHPLPKEYLPKN